VRILGSALDAAIFELVSPCSTAKHERPRRDELYDMRAIFFSSACLLLSLSAGLLSSTALAQGGPKPYPACDREPTNADVSGAKGAYEAGQASFNEADYGRALLYWEDAFRRDCTAAKLLLNLARAYELSGKKEHAVLALETYLERRPDAADRPSIEKRIENLRAQVAAEAEPIPVEPAVAVAATPPPEEPAKPAEPPKEEAKPHRPAWPVIMTASGAVGLGVGLGVLLDAVSTLGNVNCPNEICEANPPFSNSGQEETDRANAAVVQRTVGAITTAVGGALLAAGAATWYFTWKDPSSGASASMLPVVAPGYAGLSLRGRF
jgi:tetratricopeptide (TPR) repeat protein